MKWPGLPPLEFVWNEMASAIYVLFESSTCPDFGRYKFLVKAYRSQDFL
jgi:hypothetical protein